MHTNVFDSSKIALQNTNKIQFLKHSVVKISVTFSSNVLGEVASGYVILRIN